MPLLDVKTRAASAGFLRLLSRTRANTYDGMKCVCAAIFTFCFLTSCGTSERAVVHQGWDARYRYDEGKRRLHPYYDNRRVGRSVGRDESGKIDYKVWWRNQIVNENLLKKKRR